jgi:(1->4)-alpha-D-glucan 1-alpha-D-glucosylmutase
VRATYRLQLTPSFGFREARAVVPYLRDLGVSHLYLSPVLEARAGSQHGYDVVDPRRVREELGGERELRRLCEAGLRVVLDVVPNHMATDDANPYWSDDQRRAKFFDIEPDTGRHRRFFDIDHLAGVRQEDPVVFVETHKLALTLVRQGLVDGLRVDHPDGLADPAGYLERLRTAGVEHVWAEKILDPGERLRDWPVEGTVGYEFLADVCALFVDPAGERPLTELWAELSGDARPFGEWAAEAKLEQARTTFAPDVAWLRRLWPGVEGLEEALSALPVYRTYIRDLPAPEDLHVLREADLTEWLAQAPREFVTRFQQLTPPIMAKGVEDTAFYRYVRLLALNDVGGDPSRFGIDVSTFHEGNAVRAERFPRGLLLTQTHDTKRSGDVRARIGALAGMADEWAAAVRSWRELCAPLRAGGAPDAIEEYTIFQTLVGAWPLEADRLCAYMEKAMREAKRNTTWVEQDADWEGRVLNYCRALYDHAPFLDAFLPLAERVAAVGERHTLRQTALKLTVPGVPDVYQGDELVALSLVDPDNRRPVDWARRRELLGTPADSPDTRKLALIQALLSLRARRPPAFLGAYTPLDVGPDVVAFLRGEELAVAMPVRGDHLDVGGLALPPGDWRPVLDGDPAGIHVLERA